MTILIINGPNLNLLENRDREQYGGNSLENISELLNNKFPAIQFIFEQFNREDEIVDSIHKSSNYDGIIINPAAFTHYSVSIRDALEICKLPKVEVHLSNITNREKFRNINITSSKCNGVISGFKDYSYVLAVHYLIELLNTIKKSA
jgi:3-dehydroquinate dehydratase-2